MSNERGSKIHVHAWSSEGTLGEAKPRCHTCIVLSSPAFHLCVWGWFSADHSFIFSGHCCFLPSSKFNPLTLICITSFFFFLLVVGSLKKDQQIIAKDVEGLSKAIDSAVAKVKVFLRMNICMCLFNFSRLTLVSEYSSSNYIWAICRKVRQKLLMGWSGGRFQFLCFQLLVTLSFSTHLCLSLSRIVRKNMTRRRFAQRVIHLLSYISFFTFLLIVPYKAILVSSDIFSLVALW